MAQPQVSEAEVNELASKIEQFGQTLTPTQQALLAEMLQSAAMAKDSDEVSGYSEYQSPFEAINGGTFIIQYYYYAPVQYYYIGSATGGLGG